MTRRTPGEARYQKDGWLNLTDTEDGDENKAIMWRVVLPAGDTAVTGASIVDEAPAGSRWSFDCDTVKDYTKTHTFIVTDPTTSEGCAATRTPRTVRSATPLRSSARPPR